MSYHDDVYSLLAADIESFFGVAGVPVHCPGVTNTQPSEGAWVDFRFFFNSNTSYALSNEKPQGDSRGFFRLGISSRPGFGVGSLIRIGDAAMLRFCKGYMIHAPTNTGIREVPVMGGFIEQPDRILVPVTFRFQGTYN